MVDVLKASFYFQISSFKKLSKFMNASYKLHSRMGEARNISSSLTFSICDI